MHQVCCAQHNPAVQTLWNANRNWPVTNSFWLVAMLLLPQVMWMYYLHTRGPYLALAAHITHVPNLRPRP